MVLLCNNYNSLFIMLLNIIGSFVNIQQIFIEHLCAKHCSRSWGYSKQDMITPSLVEFLNSLLQEAVNNVLDVLSGDHHHGEK